MRDREICSVRKHVGTRNGGRSGLNLASRSVTVLLNLLSSATLAHAGGPCVFSVSVHPLVCDATRWGHRYMSKCYVEADWTIEVKEKKERRRSDSQSGRLENGRARAASRGENRNLKRRMSPEHQGSLKEEVVRGERDGDVGGRSSYNDAKPTSSASWAQSLTSSKMALKKHTNNKRRPKTLS